MHVNGNIKIEIENNSNTPIYLQLVNAIIKLIRDGVYKENDILPSINNLSRDCGIGRETVKKAYNILADKKYIEPAQGKGFYIKTTEEGKIKRVLLLFDKLSTYKLVLYRSFTQSLGGTVDITIQLHNQDIDLFERLLDDNRDKYDYYVVVPHFPIQNEILAKVIQVLNKIPSRKLIVIDNYPQGLPDNVGAVYQNFEIDVYNGLRSGIEHLRKYNRLNVIYKSHIATYGSLYSSIIIKGVKRFCEEFNFPLTVKDILNTDEVKKGEAYLILNGQPDTELFDILRHAKNHKLELGDDIGVLSYNESPINEFIMGGLTVLSTDFVQMGKSAAEMVKTGEFQKVHNRFNLIVRGSL